MEGRKQEEAKYSATFQEQLKAFKGNGEKAGQEAQEEAVEIHSEGQQQSHLSQLHANLARVLQQVQEQEIRAPKLADDPLTLQEKMAVTNKEVACLKTLVVKAGEQQEMTSTSPQGPETECLNG